MFVYYSNNNYVYIIAALLPALYFMYYIYKHDTHEKEPTKLLLKLVISGVIAAFMAGIIETLAQNYILPVFENQSYHVQIIMLAFMVGLVEEFCKYFFLRRNTWNNPNFDYLFDGVVYSVFVSLGFAAIENVMYVFMYGLQVALTRAFLAVPAHTAFGVVMGVYYGQAKLIQKRGNKSLVKPTILIGVGLAIFMHTFYDATAMLGTETAEYLFMGFVVIMYIIMFSSIKKASRANRRV